MVLRKAVVGLTLLCALLLVSNLTDGATRGIRVTTKAGKTFDLYKDYYALVVGVSDYDKWPDLPNAVKDAKEVAGALNGLGFTVRVVTNPTSKQLRKALNAVAYNTGRKKDRAILFYFAGHGFTETLANQEKLGYIIPRDCPLLSSDPADFVDTAVSMKTIESYALRIKSKHVLMVFDSCFSGSIFALSRGAPRDISEKSARPIRAFITAGNEDEEVPDKSVFKICFVDGVKGEADLNEDGYVTGSELGVYLDTKVVNYSQGSQHPQYGKIRDPRLDKGDFIFRLASSGAFVEEPSPKKGRASLSVKANVSGARVLVDGRDMGGTPVSDVGVSSGEHTITVKKAGYESYRRRVRFEAGRSMSLYVDLSREKPRGGGFLWLPGLRTRRCEFSTSGRPITPAWSLSLAATMWRLRPQAMRPRSSG